MAVDGATAQHFISIDFSKADWVSAIAALAALVISLIGIFISALARSAAVKANDLSKEANIIADRAAKNTEALEKNLLRAEHELEEFRKSFSIPISHLIIDIESMIDDLDKRRQRRTSFKQSVRSFETEVWEILHRKIKAILLLSIDAKYITESTFHEIETDPNNPIDTIFEALDELARSGHNSARSQRAFEKFRDGTKFLCRKLMLEKEACSVRLFEKFGLN